MQPLVEKSKPTVYYSIIAGKFAERIDKQDSRYENATEREAVPACSRELSLHQVEDLGLGEGRIARKRLQGLSCSGCRVHAPAASPKSWLLHLSS